MLSCGMNGRVPAQRAKAQCPDLRPVHHRLHAHAIVYDGRLDQGVGLITKPFTTAQHAAKVRETLEKARP